MSWLFLLLAGGLEVVWAFSMKLSEGFTRTMPTLVTLITMVGSVVLLALAMRDLPLGTAYMIWTGIGTIGAFVVGFSVLGEPISVQRVIAAALILSGMVTMKLSS